MEKIKSELMVAEDMAFRNAIALKKESKLGREVLMVTRGTIFIYSSRQTGGNSDPERKDKGSLDGQSEDPQTVLR